MPRANTLRLQRFRKTNPRTDYYAGEDAKLAIEIMKRRNPSFTMQQVLDALILACAKQLALTEN
jgi:hypothetical protein